MNSKQKEILQAQLDSEKRTLKELERTYKDALKDVEKKIAELSSRKDMENLQSIIYQKHYQDAIKKQLEDSLNKLHSNEYKTVSEYLKSCYQDGYVGVMYDIAGQGMPLILPMNQNQITKAIEHDTKLNKSLYASLGEDVKALKNAVRSEISRGIAAGSTWNDIAAKMASNFKNTSFNRAYNMTVRIARTEGHRIQCQAQLDAQKKAKENGCDVFKQWDATLDGATRDTHRELDGKLAEVDDDFVYSGGTVSAPGAFGDPAEDCNCRCQLLQRARWALDEDELKTLNDRAEYFGLDKANDFDEYKSKFLEAERIMDASETDDAKTAKAQGDFREILNKSDGIESHVARMSLYSEYTEYVENTEIHGAFQYSIDDDVIYYNPKSPTYDLYDMNYVQAHELTHRMDMLEYKSFGSIAFLNAIDICRNKIMDNKQNIQTWFDAGGKYEYDFAISDIISALSMNSIEVPVGHDNDYWSDPDKIALEIFANISSIDVIGNSSKAEFKTILSELYETYKEIVK